MAKLLVTSSPHSQSNSSTRRIMLDVIISLIPALCAASIIFGLRALVLTAVCVLSCVTAEYISRKVMKRENTVDDLSAVVTGLLLALNLPANFPFAMAVIGSVIAIVVVKQFFGGLGQNFVNPAIAARIILMLCFASAMTSFPNPLDKQELWINGVTGATPLPSIGKDGETFPTLTNLFWGVYGGSMGETCTPALLLGGIYLCIRRVITPEIPVLFISTVFLFALIFTGSAETALMLILSGGLFLGAIFMATDYVTSPVTIKGKAIYAIGCGLITSVIRFYGSLPEGVSYSIILMNILTPLIDKATLNKPFGQKKEAKK